MFRLLNTAGSNGLRLAALNSLLAVFCTLTFSGSLAVVGVLSIWLRSATGKLDAYVPFPAPYLLVSYALVFIVAWILFTKQLPAVTVRETVKTTLIGSMPLFGLSLLGYAAVVWVVLLGDFDSDQMLVATVWVYGMISTLILLAGISCVVVILLVAGAARSKM